MISFGSVFFTTSSVSRRDTKQCKAKNIRWLSRLGKKHHTQNYNCCRYDKNRKRIYDTADYLSYHYLFSSSF